MSGRFQNGLFLLFFALSTYFISREMRTWMPGPEVVRFEFLRTVARADALIGSREWQVRNADGPDRSDRLRQATRWDFLYIISYVCLFVFLIRTTLGTTGKRVQTMTLLLLAAGFSDVLENMCLLRILDGARGFYPALMTGLASVKFGLLVAVLAWLLLLAGLRLRGKRRKLPA